MSLLMCSRRLMPNTFTFFLPLTSCKNTEEDMRLDKHPKSVVCIMSAIGLFIIGAILTLAFFDNTTLLGVGVAMAVVGGAGAILGCINLLARRSDEKDDDDAGGQGIAPPRIPPPKELYYGESYDEANRGTLYYEPCTSSPPRALPNVDEDGIPMDDQEGPEGGRRGFFDPSENTAGGIIYVSPGKQMSALNFPLSPMDRRSYPLPTGILQGGVSPPPQMAQRSSSSHSGGIAVDINPRGFAPGVGVGHDASGASTHNVDPISLSRNFAANNTSSHPWQQGPPPPGGMLRRPMHYDANVSMRTPRRGNDAEGWSPQN